MLSEMSVDQIAFFSGCEAVVPVVGMLQQDAAARLVTIPLGVSVDGSRQWIEDHERYLPSGEAGEDDLITKAEIIVPGLGCRVRNPVGQDHKFVPAGFSVAFPCPAFVLDSPGGAVCHPQGAAGPSGNRTLD